PATISASGQASVAAKANSLTGTYGVTANTQGGNTVNFNLTNLCPAITLAPTTLPNGTVGVSYNQNISATPTGTTYSFTVSNGSLPSGLTLNSANGSISGTPSQDGAFTFTVTATGFGTCNGSQSYTLTIAQPNPVPTLLSLNPNTRVAGSPGFTLTL